MPYYELLCLANGRLGRAELGDLLKKTCRAFMENGATVTRISPLGATGHGPRKLAYRIRQNQQTYDSGFYVNVCAFSSPQALAEVSRQLKIDERVIRHLPLKRSFKDAIEPIPDVDQVPPPTGGSDPNDPEFALRKFMAEYEQEFPKGALHQSSDLAKENKSSGDTDSSKPVDRTVDSVLASLKTSAQATKTQRSTGLDWLSRLKKDPER